VTALAAKVARPRLRVVLYHHVADHASSLVDRLAVTTPPDVFEAHVQRIARDYQVVSLDDVLSGELPRRALLITFDDGYRSIAEVALPMLRQLGLPSVFFVTGECLRSDSLPLDNLLSQLCSNAGIGRVGAALNGAGRRTDTFPQLLDLVAAMPYERRLAVGDELAEHFALDEARLRAESRMFLDPEELAGLAADGCEVANHSRTHVFCRSIVDEASAYTELVEHARRLESLTGRAVRAFSFPYGRRDDATPMVERVLRESGHEAIFLAESRPHLTGASGRLWNRVTLDGCPAWRVVLDVELKPALRAGRDRMRARRRPGVRRGTPGPPRAQEGSRPEDGEL
jgi:peptidoglycan/xylan/chitin deacetylase (PgdA/CDA1 family)